MYRITTTHKTFDVKANWSLTIGGMAYFLNWFVLVATFPEHEVKGLLWAK
jgi:hypothetical protein